MNANAKVKGIVSLGTAFVDSIRVSVYFPGLSAFQFQH